MTIFHLTPIWVLNRHYNIYQSEFMPIYLTGYVLGVKNKLVLYLSIARANVIYYE